MSSFNNNNSFLQNSAGILLDKFITVQAAAEVTGYCSQYLRRLLRNGKLEGIKVGQVWLIKISSLGAHLKRTESTGDHRCGPRLTRVAEVYTSVNDSCIQMHTPGEVESGNERVDP
jgi:excisionase family DNA binding protein